MKSLAVDVFARVVNQHNDHHQPAQEIYGINTPINFFNCLGYIFSCINRLSQLQVLAFSVGTLPLPVIINLSVSFSLFEIHQKLIDLNRQNLNKVFLTFYPSIQKAQQIASPCWLEKFLLPFTV